MTSIGWGPSGKGSSGRGARGQMLRVVFPLRGPGTVQHGIREKWGKSTKFPSPLRHPKAGKIAQKREKYSKKMQSLEFSVISTICRGRTREGNFVSFPHLGISAPEGSREKTNCKSNVYVPSLEPKTVNLLSRVPGREDW